MSGHQALHWVHFSSWEVLEISQLIISLIDLKLGHLKKLIMVEDGLLGFLGLFLRLNFLIVPAQIGWHLPVTEEGPAEDPVAIS